VTEKRIYLGFYEWVIMTYFPLYNIKCIFVTMYGVK